MKTSLLASLVFAAAVLTAPAWAKETPAPLTNGDLDLAHKLENAFVKVAAQASESVVVITSTHKATATTEEDEDGNPLDQFKGTPFERFFRYHRMPEQPEDTKAEGSGVIIRADGYILTNAHVVDGADEVQVRLKDGREFKAKVVGADPSTDVAVVKVDGKDLPVAQIGDSDKVRVGQWAIAIGAPYELDYSFTVGFVSAKGRSARGRASNAYEDFIQTDASINPGNSGGPLCDIEGRVIGINAMIRGLNRGIGFAIPINMAKEIADQLMDKGRIVRPWLGIGIASLDEVKELSGNTKQGVIVTQVKRNTPAGKAGVKPTDIITAVDGVPVKTPKELQLLVLHKQVGDTVKLDVVRGGKSIIVSVKTEEMNDELRHASNDAPGKPKAERTYGLSVQTLTADLAKQFDAEMGEGVVVTSVAEGSLAESTGLQRGDVITEVDRATVHSAEEFSAELAKADAKKGVLLFVKRDGAATFVVLKDGK